MACRRRHTRCALVTGVQTWARPFSLEVLALDVDLRAGVFAALLPEFDRIELHPDLVVLLLERDLDRQAVAVPDRDVGRVEAGPVIRLDDDVLSSEERRVGKDWVRTGRSRWPTNPYKK